MEIGAWHGRCSARCETARSPVGPKMWRGEARRGRAGQAFELGEPGVVDGTTANSLAAGCRGPRQDDQAAKTKPLTRGCSRILDQSLGPTRARLQGTGRLNSPARWPGWFKGGLDIPATHAECSSLRTGTPDPDVDAPCLVTRWASRKCSFASHRSLLCEDALPVVHQPIEQGPGHSAVPIRDGRPFS